MESKTYRILYKGEESEPFTLNNGIPQGDSLSPTLFCLYINDLFYKLDRNKNLYSPIKISKIELTSIAYADDILLMSETQNGIIKQIETVEEYCSLHGLKINYDKSKILVQNCKTKYDHVNINIKNEQIKN